MNKKVYTDEVLKSGSGSWKDLSSTGLTRTGHGSREHWTIRGIIPQIISHSCEDYAKIKSLTEEVRNKAEKLSRNSMKNRQLQLRADKLLHNLKDG